MIELANPGWLSWLKICLQWRRPWVQSLGQENTLDKERTTHSSIPAWKIPWIDEPGVLLSKESQRVGHNWDDNIYSHDWTGVLRAQPAFNPVYEIKCSFWTLWEKAKVGTFARSALKHVYYLGWNRSPGQVGCMRQVLGLVHWENPEGSGGEGGWEGG